MKQKKTIVGTIIRWCFVVFCFLTIPVYGFNLGTIVFLFLGIVALPIKIIQELWRKIPVVGKKKPTILAILFVVAILMIPQEALDTANKKNEQTETWKNQMENDSETTVLHEHTTEIAESQSEEETTENQATTQEATTQGSITQEATTPEATIHEGITQEVTTQETTMSEPITPEITEQETTIQELITTTNSYIKIIANKNSKAYHVESCNRLPKEENRIYFNNEAEANAAGWDNPCDFCIP